MGLLIVLKVDLRRLYTETKFHCEVLFRNFINET